MPKYRATQKLLDAISKGEFENFGIVNTQYKVPIFECLIEINKDWTLKLVVDEDAVVSNPDFFEKIKEEENG